MCLRTPLVARCILYVCSAIKQMATGVLSSARSPYPGPCQTNIFNLACANAMSLVCGGGQQTSDSAAPVSDLLNPNSNCFVWRIQMENAYAEGLVSQDLIKPLNTAKNNWCNGGGAGSRECDCLAFPTRQAAQCSAQAQVQRGCNVNDPNCSGRLFIRNNDGCNGCCRNANNEIIPCEGQYIQIETTQCIPYYCWVAECFSPEQLLTSNIIDATLPGGDCYQGLCVTAVGTSQIQIQSAPGDPGIPASMFPPNAASGSFTPGYNILANCGAPNNPLPLITPTLYVRTIDQMNIPIGVVVSNSGIIGLTLRLVTPQLAPPNYGWASAPTQIVVPPKGIAQFVVTFSYAALLPSYNNAALGTTDGVVETSSAVVAPAPGVIPAATWTYEYSWEGTTQQFILSFGDAKAFQLGLRLFPPSTAPAQPLPRPSLLPLGGWIALAACFAFFLLALAKSAFEDGNIMQVLKDGKEVLARAESGGPLGEGVKITTGNALDTGSSLGSSNLLTGPNLFPPNPFT